MNEHGQRWEEQRERLSAYLDSRLPSTERAALEHHLAECARCTAELAELRQVVALLGAMPAPRLPRSFTLPETTAREVPALVQRRATGSARRSAPVWTEAARWAGGLAAAAGFVLLVGSGLAGFGGHLAAGGASTAASSSVPASSHAFPTVPQPNGHPQYGAASPSTAAAPAPTGGLLDQNTPATANASVGPGATQPAEKTTHAHQFGQGGAALSIEPVDLPIAGASLLLAGVATFTAGTVARRRATQ